MAVDDSSLLPKAPPPRPARRNAAVEAALRRFDGSEEPAAAEPGRRSKWAWGRHPQYGLAMSAALVAVIGLPAALIAIRNADLAPPPEVRPAPKQVNSEAADLAAAAPAESPQPKLPLEPTARSPIARPEPDRLRMPSDDAADAVISSTPVATYAAPQPAVAAPPPSAPPPPPAAERAADMESGESSVVVTGSRISSPNVWAERVRDGRGKATSEQKSEVTTTAPDWVRNDLGYQRFLTQLQGAVRSNDRAAVTGLISYPLRVNVAGQAKSYRDARAVQADYDRIFTPRVRSAILAQRFENLFGRDQGVMIGDGAVWFDHICRNTSCSPPGPVRIRAINP